MKNKIAQFIVKSADLLDLPTRGGVHPIRSREIGMRDRSRRRLRERQLPPAPAMPNIDYGHPGIATTLREPTPAMPEYLQGARQIGLNIPGIPGDAYKTHVAPQLPGVDVPPVDYGQPPIVRDDWSPSPTSKVSPATHPGTLWGGPGRTPGALQSLPRPSRRPVPLRPRGLDGAMGAAAAHLSRYFE